MIDIVNKEKCCGCHACFQVCPKQCISFVEDEEGFKYPTVKQKLCIGCGLCEKVCPCLSQSEKRQPIHVYAAINPDENIRMNSSSGGIFSLLAEKILEDGGVVFGARFNEKWEVVHDYTETKNGLRAFRGSKYVQSIIGDTYKKVLRFLKNGRKVLFTGTPCQVHGLRLFLRKDYENLITVDFICHGVPSPGVFRWYIQEELYKYAALTGCKNSVSFTPIHSIPKGDILMPEGVSIEDIRFRDKCEGWQKYSFVLCLAEASADGKKNTVSFSAIANNNPFLKGFLHNLYLRPSCHDCPTKSLKSGSDVTIADFWRIERIHPEMNDDRGVSTIIVNTSKGHELCAAFIDLFVTCDFKFVKKYNSAIDNNPQIPSQRAIFFQNNGTKSFAYLIDYLCKVTFTQFVKSKFKELLNSLVK